MVDDALRIALLSYRGAEHVGGQGVYVRNLSRALVDLGHSVEVIAGTPPPPVDPGVTLTHLPGLDLYDDEDPFRRPALSEFRDAVDVLEFATMCTAGFPEPRTFSLRAARHLADRVGEFDVVHDNQCLGSGLLDVARHLPLVATIHHPIHRDRALELASATGWRRLTLRRWYGFTSMQARVARAVPDIVTVSPSSARDIVADMGVAPHQVAVVPVGFDPAVFRRRPDVDRVPGRIVTTASADVPLKGLSHLLRAIAELGAAGRDVELVVVGTLREDGPTARLLHGLGLADRVAFRSGLADEDLAGLLASATVVAVPSLYEGFSLPAVEAMACATPVVATTGGALPDVVGEAGVLVAPGDAAALAAGLARVLDDPERADALGRLGHDRVRGRFTWDAVARATVAVHRRAIARHHGHAVLPLPVPDRDPFPVAPTGSAGRVDRRSAATGDAGHRLRAGAGGRGVAGAATRETA